MQNSLPTFLLSFFHTYFDYLVQNNDMIFFPEHQIDV